MGEDGPVTSAPQSSNPGWRLIVPVKDTAGAKSRLLLPREVDRSALALAMAQDTLTAACHTVSPARVTVVTPDPVLGAWARARGNRVVPDPGRGLDGAVVAGWEVASGAFGEPWAVLLGDIPALRPEDLGQALAACAGHPIAVVPDSDGTGTVLLTGRGRPHPRFGPGSAARHGRHGITLDLDLPRLRRDVDTLDDLRAAASLGLGPATAAALEGATPATTCRTGP